MAKFLFLGTGASAGIPMIGCKCKVCLSNDPHNKRLRPSALLTIENKNLLIDPCPDFRQQALRSGMTHLEGILLTHTHYDHIGGIDEVRVFYLIHKQPIPVLLSASSFEDLKKRYHYLFKEKSWGMSLTAQLTFQVLEEKRGEISFLGLPIRYLSYEQGGMEVTGYRFGKFAYISDIREYPETVFKDLQGVEILVLSALRHTLSPMHLNVEEAIAFANKIGPKRVYFTHIAHDIEHAAASKQLPSGIQFAYDGLEIEMEDSLLKNFS